MSDAGDEVPVETQEVQATEAPKGKMSVEDALQVGFSPPLLCVSSSLVLTNTLRVERLEGISPTRRPRPWSS
jgi:hypothetical protein